MLRSSIGSNIYLTLFPISFHLCNKLFESEHECSTVGRFRNTRIQRKLDLHT